MTDQMEEGSQGITNPASTTDVQPRRRGRPPGSKGNGGGDTTAKSKEPKSDEDIQASIAKSEERVARLKVDLAIRKNPELKDDIETVGHFYKEVEKVETAIGTGGEDAVSKEKNRLEKLLAKQQETVKTTMELLSKVDGSEIVNKLQGDRETAINGLRDIYNRTAPKLQAAGLNIATVFPEMQKYIG